jgi:hypothetical protein
MLQRKGVAIAGAMIRALRDRGQAQDLKSRLMRLQRDFNRQLLDSGKVLTME